MAARPTSSEGTHPFDRRDRAWLEASGTRKWSRHPGSVGAWIAEMDFGTAPAVAEALRHAVADEAFGYQTAAIARDLAAAVTEWMRDEFSWHVAPERIHSVNDVMAALAITLRGFTPAGSPVVVPTPTYMPFITFLPALGHPVVELPGPPTSQRWSLDLDRLEEAFKAGARTLILCNPHNPTGTVLRREELEAIAELADRHGVRVFADEVHAPLRFGTPHIPYASVSPAAAAHSVTATSASKAWNVPGLKAAQVVLGETDDAEFRRRLMSVGHGASILGVMAATAAYRDGREWLREVLAYLDDSRTLLDGLLASELPDAVHRRPEATYFSWIDLSAYRFDEPPARFLLREAGVALTDGAECGAGYDDHVRLVFALPRPVLAEAVEALGEAVRDRPGADGR